jgi:hypothetical protein
MKRALSKVHNFFLERANSQEKFGGQTVETNLKRFRDKVRNAKTSTRLTKVKKNQDYEE